MTTKRRDIVAREMLFLRVLLLGMAAVAIYTGLSLLTSPLWLPVTIGIWLSAAPMVALAILARAPDDDGADDVHPLARHRAA